MKPIKSLLCLMLVYGLFCIMPSGIQGQEIIPTDVFYLAQSIDDTLVFRYGLSDEPFLKKRISENLRPRNVYQRALAVVEEFSVLHPNLIDQLQLETARRINMNTAIPRDVYGLLQMIRRALETTGMFMEFAGERSSKAPSDVFQMLRQLSWHHLAIAQQKNIITNWAAVTRVYEAVVMSILPQALSVADDAGMEYDVYPFPPQAVNGVTPRNIYKLISHIYDNIARYYQQTQNYDPIVLLDMNECDNVSPADVFDLIQVVVAELKAEIGIKPLSPDTLERYEIWKQAHDTIVPGHTFRLGQYIYLLTKRVLSQYE